MVSARSAFSIPAIVWMDSTRARFCTFSSHTASSPVGDKWGESLNASRRNVTGGVVEHEHSATGGHIPEADRVVIAACSQSGAIG